MSITFGIGLVVGLLAVLVTVVILKKQNKNKYDERQVAARGKAFAGGFMTFLFSEVVVFTIEIFTGEPLVIGVPGVLSVIIMLLAALVFVEVSIFMDAYFQPNKKMPKIWYISTTLLGIIFIIQALRDNDYWYRYINLAAGIFVLIIMTSLLVKKLISKKAEKEDEEE